jgi:regulatory protein
VQYLARRARTEAQVAAFLARAGASAACIRTLLARFRKRGYLDDATYALQWAQARLARRPVGPARLEAELLAKGFDQSVAEKAVRQIYAEVDQRELARSLLAQKPSRRNATFLRQQGFDDETIEAVLEMSESV